VAALHRRQRLAGTGSGGPGSGGPGSGGPGPGSGGTWAGSPGAGPAAPALTVRRGLGRPGRLSRRRAIAQLPESGRGLAIMRACVDDVTLRSGPGQGTVVSLRKRVDRRPDPLATVPRPRLRDAS
jgi:hypothetical protein